MLRSEAVEFVLRFLNTLARRLRLLPALTVALAAFPATAAFTNFINFETPPVHPVALGPDGRTLAVCNLPDNRVEFFDVSSGIPVPVGSVPVGLDPVTARFASSNELWVVNYISSSISVVDVAAQTVVATIETPAGPSDLVFAGNPRRAWVSCSRTNAVFVINPTNRLAVTNLPIQGEMPRAMATSPDGSKVYVAIFESGNGTTILGSKLTDLNAFPAPGPVEATNGPHRGVNPPPNSGTNFFPARAITNPPPKVAHIVRKNAAGQWLDDNNGNWTPWISGTNAPLGGRIVGWDLPDRDVAIINTTNFQITYAHRLMNMCLAIGVNPASGEISVVGTEGVNEKRFEPVLNGVFHRVNLALVDPVTRTNRIRDLNPHLDYITRLLPEPQRALGLGDPRAIEWNAAGTRAYITGMGSRNLVIVDANGARVNPQPVELPEGPTGLALDEARARLYVWNRFSSSLSVVETVGHTVLTNIPVFDPTPAVVQSGRRALYDTRRTSGLGIASCASCHVDGRTDRLAWDLGNPAEHLSTNAGFVFHPMKGPMVTQTLQDIITPTNFNGIAQIQQPLHWRGDKKNIEEFNPTFTNLQSAEFALTTNEMADFKTMLASIFFPPNFLRTFSNTLPASVPLPGHYGRALTNGGPGPALPPGNAQMGFTRFDRADCRICHDQNQGRSVIQNELFNLPREGAQGAFKSSQLRSMGEKLGFDGLSTNSRAGFGFQHDGRVDTLTRFMVDGFAGNVTNDQAIADFIAFMLCFSGSDLSVNPSNPSQDVPAAVGKQITFTSPAPPALLNSMVALATRTNSRVQLVVRGKQNGRPRGWLLRRATGDFLSDRNGEIAPTLASVIAPAASTNPFTAMLVPEGSGLRIGVDRDGDNHYDAIELDGDSNLADASSVPLPLVKVSKVSTNLVLTWTSTPGASYAPDVSVFLTPESWIQMLSPAAATTNLTTLNLGPPTNPRRFYRVRLLK